MIFGHKKNIKIFSKRLEGDKFPHAVLFAGPSRIGKRAMAIEIAKYLQGSHKESFYDFSKKECSCQDCTLVKEGKSPAIIELGGEGEQISIQKMRETRKTLSFSSFYPYKIVIINDVDLLSQEAAGALLKTLEEPRGKTIFFLLSQKPSLILKTILSRVEIFKFHLLLKTEIVNFINILIPNKISIDNDIVDFALGRPGIAKELAIDKNKIIYYNKVLEIVQKIKKYSIIEKFLLAEKLEKEDKLEDFLLLGQYWFLDIISFKNNISFLFFNSKKEKLKEENEKYSENEIGDWLKQFQKTENQLLFSNTSKLLAIENLLLRI